MLAILIPLISYFIVKKTSESAVQMPRHYLFDSTATTVKNGKKIIDSVWHKLPDFSFTNQLGQRVSWDDLHGKVVVVDFFFTHCPTICPALTKSMKRLQDGITNSKRVGDKTPDFLHLISLSIDPERDSVERLKMWADRFQVNPDQWWLLTGPKKEIYDMAIKEMKILVEDGKGVDTSFIHTDHFVLIDTNRHVRGYYHGLDSASVAKLSEDIILLTLEKDKTKKSFLAGKLQLLAVVFLMAIGAVGVFLFIFRKRKSNVTSGLEAK
ncbi:MAG: SCO family protein [Chitinophagaceae bacterium]|nr:SCO family protein [Chitinophagaceae bacterium]